MNALAQVDTGQHLLWLGSRSLGVVALGLVSLSVGLGLALSTRIHGRPGTAARLGTIHEAVSLVAIAAIAGHGLLLLGDAYLHPTLVQIAVPFLLPNRPLWTGAGVIAGWLALLFTLSFYVRPRIGNRLWRRMHRWTAAVFVLGLVHAIGAGSDSTSAWLIAMFVLAGAPVVLLGALRLIRLYDAGAGTRDPAARVRAEPGR
jgi:sulfoxide reductase heme-binding subunit YedZ